MSRPTLQSEFHWEGQEQTVTLTDNGVLDLRQVFQIDMDNHLDDPLLHAFQGAWSQFFDGSMPDTLPIPLTLATPSIRQPLLGDLVAFALSYGSSPQYGSGRMLALAVRILSQLGDFLSNIQCLEPAMTLCKKNDLPLVTPIQRKTHAPESNIHAAEPDDETESSADYRLSCLAAVAEAFYFINKVESKSLAIISDASDISGADITIFFAYSPVLAGGWLLPHQVPPPCALR